MSSQRENAKPKRPWQEVAREAQQHRASTIAAVQPQLPALPQPLPGNVTAIAGQVLSHRERYITSLSVNALLDALAGRSIGERLRAVEVANAFLRRAALAQKLVGVSGRFHDYFKQSTDEHVKVNCVTELLPGRALERARFLDAYFERHGRPMGPLHGLPVSVKEHIGIKGLRLHASYIAMWDNVATRDAHVLQILENAGAVFHARTTQPQTMMHLETSSNLYGTTTSPYNSDLTSGGSSGGEGALGGLGGSVLGVGSDVGGSIRSPAANNGIWGLRPSSFRIPTDGWSCWAANVDEIPGVIGPLGKDLDGIEVFMKVVIGARPWLVEPALLPLQWTPYQVDSTAERPLTIAIMFHDDVVLPHPPITRAIEAMASKLGGLAHVCVSRWKPYHHQKAWAIISSLYYPDGGDEDAPLLEQAGEPMLALTRWIRGGPWVHKLTVGELQHWKREREGYRSEYARIWNEAAVDAILCPAGPGLAPAHETARYWGYTSQWNLLDYPAIVFPVSIANAQVDRKQRASDPMTSDDRYNWHLYDPDMFDKAPISLQLVCRRYEDEKVVGIMRHLQERLQFPFGPLS